MIEVHGADQLAKLSRDLKEAGAKDLQRELSKAIRDAIGPIKGDMLASIDQNVPTRGGLRDRVRREIKFSTSRRQTGLRLVAKHRYQLRNLDRGLIRHPLFGNREKWFTTRFAPGVLSEPFERNAPQARDKIHKAMDRVTTKIAK